MVAKWRGVWMDLEGVCLCVSGWGCVCVFSYCVGGRVGFFFFRVVYVYYIHTERARARERARASKRETSVVWVWVCL